MLRLSSRRPSRTLLAGTLALLAALAAARAGTGISERPPRETSTDAWQPLRPVSIAVRNGRAAFEVPTHDADARTLVIVSSLAKAAGPFPVRLSAAPASQARPPFRSPPKPGRRPASSLSPLPPVRNPVSGLPARERSFHLLVRDGDVASASNYLAVTGELRAVGQRVQVYVDRNDAATVGPELLRDLVRTFDDEVFPTSARSLGQARDVDGDGRFTVLMSSWLTRLAGGRHAVDGFVRGADLDPAVSAPFGNHCDMMYLSTALKAGPYLRTVLAHEYTHAITFSAKALAGPGGTRSGRDEDGWLDEAIAHLAEDLHGFSRENLDYRVSAFLSCTERYRLVVDDYFSAGLFRSHGNRGGTYLFLRWCADRFGPDLLPALVRSERHGIANVEAATGMPFDELFRQWTTALYLSGLDPSASGDVAYRSVDLRGPFDAWELAGPRAATVTPGGPVHGWNLAGTSTSFTEVMGSATGAVAIEVIGPAEAELQVTAVALPHGLPRLELSARLSSTSGGEYELRAQVRQDNGSAVRLSALAWEPLVPGADPHASVFRHGDLDMLGIADRFGSSTIPVRGRLASQPIRLPALPPGDGSLVVKVVGTDEKGRRIAAWTDLTLNAEPDASPDGLTSAP